MSLDESASIHEIAIRPIRDALNLPSFLYFSWVIAAAPLLLMGAIYFIPRVWRVEPRLRRRMLVSAVVYVSGAFGIEMIAGHYMSTGNSPAAYAVAMSFEEGCEISGLTLFVTALFDGLRARIQAVESERALHLLAA